MKVKNPIVYKKILTKKIKKRPIYKRTFFEISKVHMTDSFRVGKFYKPITID